MASLPTRLRLWLKRRRMWANRTCWTWPRKQSTNPIVQAVRRWKELPSMGPRRG